MGKGKGTKRVPGHSQIPPSEKGSVASTMQLTPSIPSSKSASAKKSSKIKKYDAKGKKKDPPPNPPLPPSGHSGQSASGDDHSTELLGLNALRNMDVKQVLVERLADLDLKA